MLKKLSIVLASSFLLLNVANASDATIGGEKTDTRIKTFTYSQEKVFDINANVNTALQIELEEGETDFTVAIGDSSTWDIETDKNKILLKPNEEAKLTNLIINTEKRVYVLDLNVNQESSPVQSDYIVRFIYPITQRIN